MDGRFLSAFIVPESWDILGYKLKPFTLRHMLYLTALKSPFIDKKPDTGITPEAVLVLLRVCSSEHPSKAFRRPTIADYWRQGKMESDIEFFYGTVGTVFNYIQTCSSAPEVYKKEDNSLVPKKENLPPALSLATSLMVKLHIPEKAAWETPVGQALWYLTTVAINEGAEIKILSTEDEARAVYEKQVLKELEVEMQQKVAEAKQQAAEAKRNKRK